ncbi:MAG: sensor histidine kinase, partial [Nitrosospira sp.]
PGQETRNLIVSAQKLEYADEDSVRLLLTVADVTAARAAERCKEALLQQKDILLQEMNHRIANGLQIIASLLLQSARNVQSDEARRHLRDAHRRVMAVAALQKNLSVSRLGDVELRPYFAVLCESLAASMIGDHSRLSLEVIADEEIATANFAVSLGLIATELVINALKHAFPDDRDGTITITYRKNESGWSLSITDDGVGMPPAIQVTAGLGTGIVQAISKQLDANFHITEADPGTTISIVHTRAVDARPAGAACQQIHA